MTMTPNDIGGDESTARRVLVLARSIAPCIDSFTEDSEQKKDAIAILQGVLGELPAPGSKRTTQLSRNGTSMSFRDIASAFDDDARASLQALCSAPTSGAQPGTVIAGSFPKARAFERVWPEGEYT
ncbi:hypothetical protein ACI3KS_05135 [Microbacterium sp. ZW T5_45]|uniref:hypothetical protein n=1 Tax=Microbacterium sp. ZW T5_45 TaxID=3378080 RepID=UPI003853166C